MEIVKSKVDEETEYKFTQDKFTIMRNGDKLHCKYADMVEFAKHFDEDIKAEIMEFYNKRYPICQCVICGKDFRKFRHTAVTCGKSDCVKERSRQTDRAKKERLKEERYQNRELKKAECVTCGKTFYRKHGRQLTCCHECGKIREREVQRKNRQEAYEREKRKLNGNKALDEKVKLARSMGLSYGQLQAMQTIKELRGEA